MEIKTFEAELEKFARWFDKKDHGNDNFNKIVKRYLKENKDEISEEVHFCEGSICECRTDLDRSPY